MDNDESTTGFSKLVSAREFKQHAQTNDKEHKRINLALWGDEGTTGVVKAVNDLSLQVKILIAALVFVQPLLFAVILRWLGM